MVKYPEAHRRSLSGLENLLNRVAGGGEISLKQAAKIIPTPTPIRIQRINGARVHNVSANVVPGVTTGNKVLAAFSENELPLILAKYPGLKYSFEGEHREQRDSMADFRRRALAPP